MTTSTADLRIPDLGEGVDEGTVIALLVAVGEHVVAGQSVLEIETDKVTLEIPAPRAGTISDLCVSVDSLVHPGDVVLRMTDDVVAVATTEKLTLSPLAQPTMCTPEPEQAAPAQASASVIPAGPAARREARQLGVDIATISGSGPGGRIVRDDVRGYVRKTMNTGASATAQYQQPALPELSAFGTVRRQPMSRLERASARNLVRSASLIPHAWVAINADVTQLEKARKRMRAEQASDAPPLTLSAILTKTLALAMSKYPKFNAAIDTSTDEIVYREYVNVAVAVDTERGLLVPVVRTVNELSIIEIARELQRLSESARNDQLTPASLTGGGMTLSNLGQFGVSAIQPIVSWPQPAILGVAAATDVVVANNDGLRRGANYR